MSVRGQKLKIIPIFNKENELYENYMGTAIGDFETDLEKYFFYNIGFEGYGIESYYDLLVASYYVISKKNSKSFIYSSKLVKLFFLLFPTAEIYSQALEREAENTYKNIYLYRRFFNNQDQILGYYNNLKNQLDYIQSLLSIKNNIKGQDYLDVSNSFIKGVYNVIKDNIEEVEITPSDSIEWFYYNRHPDKSWQKNPLGFFINFLYGKGYQQLQILREDDSNIYGDVNELSIYIHNVYKREFSISLRLLKEQIKIALPKNRQENINIICDHISTLFNKSFSHPIMKIYQYPVRPFTSFIKNLQADFSTFNFPVEFNYEEEFDEPFIYEPKFIKKLLSLTLINKSGEKVNLFSLPTSVLQFGYFERGDFDPIKKLDFAWDTFQVYYLIINLIDSGATISFPREEDTQPNPINNKIFIKGKPFSRDNFYTYKSKLKNKKVNPPKDFHKIDSFFR